MSVTVMTWVWQHSAATGNDLLVALALADNADDHGECWPKQRYLAEKTRLSLSTVKRSVVALQLLGELHVTARNNESRSNLYRLLMPESREKHDLPPAQSEPGVGQIDVPLAQSEPGPQVTSDLGPQFTGEPSKNRQLEPSEKNSSSSALVARDAAPAVALHPAGVAMLDRLQRGAAAAAMTGANAWNMHEQLLGAFDELWRTDGLSAAGTLALLWAQATSGRDLSAREQRRLQHVLLTHGRRGLLAIVEAVAAMPDDLGGYAQKIAQRMSVEARS